MFSGLGDLKVRMEMAIEAEEKTIRMIKKQIETIEQLKTTMDLFNQKTDRQQPGHDPTLRDVEAGLSRHSNIPRKT